MKSIYLFACSLVFVTFCNAVSFGPEEDKTVKDDFVQKGSMRIMSAIGPVNQLCSGVNIHFTRGHERDLDMIAAAGFKFIRMDFGWQSTEREKGVYNWEAFDELTNNLEKRGIKALYILDYSNSLYESSTLIKDQATGVERRVTNSPQTPESVAAFAKWAAAAAEHFKGRNIIWELWNEPNLSNFWRPQADVEQYKTLCLATCKAIKEKVPDSYIIGPATSGFPYPFLEAILASGILDYLDAVSVHPYRGPQRAPETAIEDYAKLREMIDQYASASKKGMPIISGEWGYSNFNRGVPRETQAATLPRMIMTNLYAGVPLSIWYDWKDDGTDPAENEHNFGTVTYDLIPKASYITAMTMSRHLDGFTFVKRMDVRNESNFVMVFKNDRDEYKVSAWTIGQPHSIVLDLNIPDLSGVKIMDGKGNIMKVDSYRGRLIAALTDLPQYIDLPREVKIE